jgi:hypothetical protein
MGLGQLEDHAWQAHRLVLRRGRWLPAWEVIEGWLDEFAAGRGDAALCRALELAALDDAQAGPARLAEMAARKGVRHPSLPRRGLPWNKIGCVVGAVLAVLALLSLLLRR